MKYLNTFQLFNENNFGHSALDSNNSNSPYTKNYGEPYPIEQVKVGAKILYTGTEYFVINNTGVTLELSKTPNGTVFMTVNGQQFNDKGCILKEENLNESIENQDEITELVNAAVDYMDKNDIQGAISIILQLHPIAKSIATDIEANKEAMYLLKPLADKFKTLPENIRQEITMATKSKNI